MKLFLLFLLFIIPNMSIAAGNMEIEDSDTIAELSEIQEQIDSISSAVTGCMESGGKHKQCICQNREMFSRFSFTVNAFFKEHPELEDQDLVNFKTPDGTLVNQSLVGIRKQANMKLECENKFHK